MLSPNVSVGRREIPGCLALFTYGIFYLNSYKVVLYPTQLKWRLWTFILAPFHCPLFWGWRLRHTASKLCSSLLLVSVSSCYYVYREERTSLLEKKTLSTWQSTVLSNSINSSQIENFVLVDESFMLVQYVYKSEILENNATAEYTFIIKHEIGCDKYCDGCNFSVRAMKQ